MVTEWQTHSPTTLEVTVTRLSVGVISRFISQIDAVFGMEGRKMVCVALQEFTVTCNFIDDKW